MRDRQCDPCRPAALSIPVEAPFLAANEKPQSIRTNGDAQPEIPRKSRDVVNRDARSEDEMIGRPEAAHTPAELERERAGEGDLGNRGKPGAEPCRVLRQLVLQSLSL